VVQWGTGDELWQLCYCGLQFDDYLVVALNTVTGVVVQKLEIESQTCEK
jgi:hypothetical protein